MVIPVPRPASGDHAAGLPTHQQDTRSGKPVWWYDHPRKRGEDRRYWGEVEWIGGPEADELRGKLTEIVRDLFDWARTQQHTPETGQTTDPKTDLVADSDTDSETRSRMDSDEDGDTDDTLT